MENIADYIVKTNETKWIPLSEHGKDYDHIAVIPLHVNKEQNRSDRILLKFEPGASYPYHNHPGGEDIFVVQGSCVIENALLQQGDYLYTPPNYKHSVKSEGGCILLLHIPEEVEIIK